MPRLLAAALLGAAFLPTVQRPDAPVLDLVVHSGGSGVVVVSPGERIPFVVEGVLGGAETGGLALFSFDLEAGGMSIESVGPTEAMAPFDRPLGVTNPDGFGGTMVDGRWVQIGGAQNTIRSRFADFPKGEVVEGIGLGGRPVSLARGELVAPETDGLHSLVPIGLVANALAAGQEGRSFWTCVPVLPGSARGLAVWVVSGPHTLAVDAPPVRSAGPPLPDEFFAPRMGEPLAGLTAFEFARFTAGREQFVRVFSREEGLGPAFNDRSCAQCHADPRPGGSGPSFVTRFGRSLPGGGFDALEELGGSLLQAESIDENWVEAVPEAADVVADRVTPHMFGAGLVEALAADTIALRETTPPDSRVSGRIHRAADGAAGRFGWKGADADLSMATAVAAHDEMGLTSARFPAESAPGGDAGLAAAHDRVPDPELSAEVLLAMGDYQRFLAPPPQTPPAGMAGAALFRAVGCSACHVADPLETGSSDAAALSNQSIRPYSDFLLHDMGALGDGIGQGDARPNEMMTRALWGMGQRGRLLHDGRAGGESLADRVAEAVQAHDGEAAFSRDAYDELDDDDRGRIVDFLRSLGRGVFDAENNATVDEFDWFYLLPHFRGPGVVLGPDHPAAVADADFDGDFDLHDWRILQLAFTGR